MDKLTVTLMITAGIFHASWHSIIKAGSARITALAGMGAISGLVALFAVPFASPPSAPVWAVIAVSTVLHVGYKLCLARAYELGKLSEAYPLGRGMVPIFATLISFFLLEQVPSRQQGLGILLISIGLLILTRVTIRPDRRLLAVAMGSSLAVAGYSSLDAYGARLSGDWFSFTVWLILADAISFLVTAIAMRGRAIVIETAIMKWAIFIAGIFGVFAFGVFLWALSLSPTGPVVALRECSVLFAALIGSAVYREEISGLRLFAIFIIFFGLLIISS